MLAAGLLFLVPFGVAHGRPASHSHKLVTRSSLPSPPSDFVEGVPADSVLRLSIALPQNDVAGLHAALLDVSDPESANYGKHLSKDQVAQFVAPQAESVQAVTNWLSKNGISPTSSSATGDTMTIEVPVATANALLDANFSTFIHQGTNTSMVRTLSYALPESLADHISFVYPTTQFIPPADASASMSVVHSPAATERRRAALPDSCANAITPECLFALYNIPSIQASAPRNNLFVAGFQQDVAQQSDVEAFLKQQRPDDPDLATTFKLFSQSVDGAENFTKGTLSGSAHVEYTVGIATNVPVTYLSSGGASLEDHLDMINLLLGQDTLPLVLVTSYAFKETADQAQVDLFKRLCDAYAQLGSRGTSVIFSSGSSGVAGPINKDPECLDGGDAFLPSFPSTCPFVTSVGGTTGINPEVAAPLSSGGFSNVFPRPSYQAQAVQAYLSALNTTSTNSTSNSTSPSLQGRFNTTGRAYPDVSLQAENYLTLVDGQQASVSGTGVAAAVFASMVALLNDQLLNAGAPPIGFLNPHLYATADANAAVFRDVTEGSNPGCGTAGFPALPGWDAVTGLGTIDFEKLVAASVPGRGPLGATSSPPASRAGPTASAHASPQGPTLTPVQRPTSSLVSQGPTQTQTQTQTETTSVPPSLVIGKLAQPTLSPVAIPSGARPTVGRGRGVGVGAALAALVASVLVVV